MKTRTFTGRATINVHHGDCMDALEKMGENQYSLAIVDPPYSNETKSLDRLLQNMDGRKARAGNIRTDTIQRQPSKSYFKTLKSKAKNQVIWGVNWFNEVFGVGRVVWDKKNEASNFSDCELAYQSINRKTQKFSFRWNGMLQENMKEKEVRIHSCQKPVALYKWLLKNYAKEGDTILDTHGGSCSIAIACWDMGFDLDIWELDEDYFKAGVEHIEKHVRQGQFNF